MKIEVHQNRGEIGGLPSCDSPLGKKEGKESTDFHSSWRVSGIPTSGMCGLTSRSHML